MVEDMERDAGLRIKLVAAALYLVAALDAAYLLGLYLTQSGPLILCFYGPPLLFVFAYARFLSRNPVTKTQLTIAIVLNSAGGIGAAWLLLFFPLVSRSLVIEPAIAFLVLVIALETFLLYASFHLFRNGRYGHAFAMPATLIVWLSWALLGTGLIHNPR